MPNTTPVFVAGAAVELLHRRGGGGVARPGAAAARPRTGVLRRARMSVGPAGGGEPSGEPEAAAAAGASVSPLEEEQLSPAEEARAAAKAEEARLRAAEKFITVDEGNHECVNCGYLYEPRAGEKLSGAAPGTAFADLSPAFVCPVCKSPRSAFVPRAKTIAGFADNQKYGFGTNSMTGNQKNTLIFGSLLLMALLLLSGYALD